MSKLIPKRILLTLNLLALVAVFGYGIQRFAVPFVSIQLHGANYKELVFKCDSVMRDHFIAKREVLNRPSEKAIQSLKAAEVGLLNCHEYDLLRKKLIDLGVTENRLARLGLEGVEEKEKDVRSFVETHEIRY